jgi:hypothetical protein
MRALPHNHQKTAPPCSPAHGAVAPARLASTTGLEPLVYIVRLSRGHRGFQSAVQIKDVQRSFRRASGAPAPLRRAQKTNPLPPPPVRLCRGRWRVIFPIFDERNRND